MRKKNIIFLEIFTIIYTQKYEKFRFNSRQAEEINLISKAATQCLGST